MKNMDGRDSRQETRNKTSDNSGDDQKTEREAMKKKNAKKMNNSMNIKKQEDGMGKQDANGERLGDWLKREEECKQAWYAFIATHEIPDEIPTRPDLVYANEGWKGWQDWLGSPDSKGNMARTVKEPNLPTPDECFISVVFDEWLKDSHCLDSKEAWDADPKRPFRFNAIMEFTTHQGLSNGSELGFLMVQEAMSRIMEIGHSAGLCTCCVVQAVGQVSLKKSDGNAFAKERLVDNGMDEKDAEVFLRSVSLYLNVISDEWPFKYVGPSKTSDDKAMDSDGGQP